MEMEITIPAFAGGDCFYSFTSSVSITDWASSRPFVRKSKCEGWTSSSVTPTLAFGQGTEPFGARELQQLTEWRDGRRSAVPDSVSEPWNPGT